MRKRKINWNKARSYFNPIAKQVREEVEKALEKDLEFKSLVLHGETMYHPRYWLMVNPLNIGEKETFMQTSAKLEQLSTKIAKKHNLQISQDRGNLTYYLRPNYQMFKR